MNVIVEGKYRRRLRINLIFFTVAGPWRETPLRWTFDAGSKAQNFKIARPIPEVELWGELRGDTAFLEVRVAGLTFNIANVALSLHPTSSFRITPVKGVEFSGTVRVEP